MPSHSPKPASKSSIAQVSIARATVEKFVEIFSQPPKLLVRAPGRVNLIGEHTDYNDGFVMPLAIDRAVWIALRPRDDRRVSVYSVDFDQREEFSLDNLIKGEHGWCEYIKGVGHFLVEKLGKDSGKLRGWDGVLAGDVPLAAGLSSSAALEVAAARAFAAVSDIDWEPAAMALLAQRAENQWIGMNCGIMDQLVSTSGIDGHAIMIDCRSLETTPVPFPENVSVVILDTGTRRGLVDSAYNQRRAHCEETAAHFSAKALRDVDLEHFEQQQDQLDETTRRRARHVITENARTVEAARAMRDGDVERLGLLMDQSHASLRDDFEVTNDALCVMVEIARRQPGCHGARMTGAGFGGCAIAIVDEAQNETFTKNVAQQYASQTGNEPTIYVCQATDGANVFEV